MANKRSPITLQQLWNEQRDYNNQVRFRKPGDYEQWMERYLLGVVSEMNEVLNEINWKAHRKGKKINRVNLARELADLTKYVFSLWEWSGFSPDDMMNYVHEKSMELAIQWGQDFDTTIPDYMPIIITDLDGTLVDYRKGFITWLKANYPQDLPTDKASTLAMEIDLGLSYPKYVKLKDEFEASGGYAYLPIYPDVREALRSLYEGEIIMLAYTARPAQSYSRIWNDTWQWFVLNQVSSFITELHIGKEQRIARACELKAQGHPVILLEDEPDTALRAAHAGIYVFVRNQPYNIGITHSNIKFFNRLDVEALKTFLSAEMQNES